MLQAIFWWFCVCCNLQRRVEGARVPQLRDYPQYRKHGDRRRSYYGPPHINPHINPHKSTASTKGKRRIMSDSRVACFGCVVVTGVLLLVILLPLSFSYGTVIVHFAMCSPSDTLMPRPYLLSYDSHCSGVLRIWFGPAQVNRICQHG